MIYITAIEMSPSGSSHEHIVNVQWKKAGTTATNWAPVAAIVSAIEANGEGSVKVEGPPAVNVGVRTAPSGRKYIQTYADKVWSNNLLALPRRLSASVR